MREDVIVYISQEFPSLTKTFTYREVLALRRRGLTIRPISTWRPHLHLLSGEARRLVGETYYLFPLLWVRLLVQHLRYLITRPGAYLSTLGLLLLFNRETLRNRLRLLLQFVYAVLASAEVERCQAQHIHADFALNAATLALIASRLTGQPFSFTAHAADIFVNPILLREKIGAARFVVAISEYNRRHLLHVANNHRAAYKIHVIHCGLDFSQFTPRLEGEHHSSLRILSVGRLVEKKGMRYLVEACHLLAQRGFDFQCGIVGQGPEAATLRDLIRTCGVSNRVRLLGPAPQERVRELLRQADVFVLPSVVGRDRDQDGIPVVLMEAMTTGISVISTRLSGIPELVRDGVNGLLVAPGDSGALADAISRLWGDPLLARRLAAEGRATVEREFNIERSAAQLADLFAKHLEPIPTTLQQSARST